MKKRADILLVERGLAATIEESRAFLMEGIVWIENQRIDKPGTLLESETLLFIRGKKTEFVSRAGDKLKHGLHCFNINPQNKVCLDIGSSTGGFTDCLLKNEAKHVFAVDVGYGLLDSKLRKDARVSVVEKHNARLITLDQLMTLSIEAKQIEIIVSDVSFISLRAIIPNLVLQCAQAKQWILLFKPQFELSADNILKGGIVKEDADVAGAMSDFSIFMRAQGLALKGGPETSPLTGKKSGNVEYLLFYEPI
ncbi:MAG: TlyA family RNA methyltransferase [Bdellovibrionales bacterium]|nr:TlyA family RNA methyltransferase [Bdellovibrionales bacterium]